MNWCHLLVCNMDLEHFRFYENQSFHPRLSLDYGNVRFSGKIIPSASLDHFLQNSGYTRNLKWTLMVQLSPNIFDDYASESLLLVTSIQGHALYRLHPYEFVRDHERLEYGDGSPLIDDQTASQIFKTTPKRFAHVRFEMKYKFSPDPTADDFEYRDQVKRLKRDDYKWYLLNILPTESEQEQDQVVYMNTPPPLDKMTTRPETSTQHFTTVNGSSDINQQFASTTLKSKVPNKPIVDIQHTTTSPITHTTLKMGSPRVNKTSSSHKYSGAGQKRRFAELIRLLLSSMSDILLPKADTQNYSAPVNVVRTESAKNMPSRESVTNPSGAKSTNTVNQYNHSEVNTNSNHPNNITAVSKLSLYRNGIAKRPTASESKLIQSVNNNTSFSTKSLPPSYNAHLKTFEAKAQVEAKPTSGDSLDTSKPSTKANIASSSNGKKHPTNESEKAITLNDFTRSDYTTRGFESTPVSYDNLGRTTPVTYVGGSTVNSIASSRNMTKKIQSSTDEAVLRKTFARFIKQNDRISNSTGNTVHSTFSGIRRLQPSEAKTDVITTLPKSAHLPTSSSIDVSAVVKSKTSGSLAETNDTSYLFQANTYGHVVKTKDMSNVSHENTSETLVKTNDTSHLSQANTSGTVVKPNDLPHLSQTNTSGTVIETNDLPHPSQPNTGGTVVKTNDLPHPSQANTSGTVVETNDLPHLSQANTSGTVIETNDLPHPSQPNTSGTVVKTNDLPHPSQANTSGTVVETNDMPHLSQPNTGGTIVKTNDLPHPSQANTSGTVVKTNDLSHLSQANTSGTVIKTNDLPHLSQTSTSGTVVKTNDLPHLSQANTSGTVVETSDLPHLSQGNTSEFPEKETNDASRQVKSNHRLPLSQINKTLPLFQINSTSALFGANGTAPVPAHTNVPPSNDKLAVSPNKGALVMSLANKRFPLPQTNDTLPLSRIGEILPFSNINDTLHMSKVNATSVVSKANGASVISLSNNTSGIPYINYLLHTTYTPAMDLSNSTLSSSHTSNTLALSKVNTTSSKLGTNYTLFVNGSLKSDGNKNRGHINYSANTPGPQEVKQQDNSETTTKANQNTQIMKNSTSTSIAETQTLSGHKPSPDTNKSTVPILISDRGKFNASNSNTRAKKPKIPEWIHNGSDIAKRVIMNTLKNVKGEKTLKWKLLAALVEEMERNLITLMGGSNPVLELQHFLPENIRKIIKRVYHPQPTSQPIHADTTPYQ